MEVPAACAAAAGSAVALDWSSFGEEPTDFVLPETPAQIVVAGIIVALADGGLTLEDISADADAPEAVSARLIDGAASRGPGSASRAWFRFIRGSITAVRADATQVRDDRYMSFVDGIVYVGDVVGENSPGRLSAAGAAALLIHEAGHGFLPPHVPCYVGGQDSCDADKEGAYGAGIWWRHVWFHHRYPGMTWSECVHLQTEMVNDCGYLLDNSFSPCDETALEWCDPLE